MKKYFITSVEDCPHCENGMITPKSWTLCDAAMKKANTWNTDAILAWFNANGGDYADYNDLPPEEIECRECGGTGTITKDRVPLHEAMKELGVLMANFNEILKLEVKR